MISERARALAPLLLLLVAAAPAARAAQAPAAVLVALEPGPDGESYRLVCRGSFEYRLVLSDDGLQVLVELHGVRNAVLSGALPSPNGRLTGLSIGGGEDGDDATRVLFALARPARAVALSREDGLEVRFEPAGLEPAAPGAVAEPPPAALPGAPAAGAGERPGGTADLREISVFEIPELNRTVRVSENGAISLPLVGEIRAGGLTPPQLEDELRRRLGQKYVRDPQVSVFVREHGSKKVSVLGAVGKPGVYEMLGPRTLLQVLAQAGGLTEDVGAVLYVIRNGGALPGKIAVDVDDLMVSRDPALNVAIEPGDVVSAPIDRPLYVYVDGAVKTPGRIEQLASRPITLLQVIAKAGGATERANLKGVQILRKSPDGTQTTVEFNIKRIRRGKEPDPILGEGDVVVVPETFF